MNAARIFGIVVAVCLFSSFVLLAQSEPTVARGDSSLDTTLTGYFKSSIDHYAAGDFEQSLKSAEEVLALLQRQVAIAYNNICSAQMQLGELALAAEACNKATELLPGFERAWSNLAWIYVKEIERKPSVAAYLNLSAAYYWQDLINRSIEASEKALELDPGNAIAHNNICAARAKSSDWDRAIRECRIALTIKPDYQLAKNNLEWAEIGAAGGIE